DELLLDELERGDRLAELDPLLRVLERPVVARHRRAHRRPRNTVARLAEAAERPAETFHVRELVLERNLTILERQLRGDRGAHRELAVDVERRETGCAALDEEAPDLAVVLLGPDHGDVGDGAVGDPELGPVQDVRVALPPGARLHRARVGAMVGLGETEAPDLLARGEAREPLLLL